MNADTHFRVWMKDCWESWKWLKYVDISLSFQLVPIFYIEIDLLRFQVVLFVWAYWVVNIEIGFLADTQLETHRTLQSSPIRFAKKKSCWNSMHPAEMATSCWWSRWKTQMWLLQPEELFSPFKWHPQFPHAVCRVQCRGKERCPKPLHIY